MRRPNETEEEYAKRLRRHEEAMKKAMAHEKSFDNNPKDSDIIEKRLGSDLFKGGRW
jgi:hypothetical protein